MPRRHPKGIAGRVRGKSNSMARGFAVPLIRVLTGFGAPTLIGGSHHPYLRTQGFMTYPYRRCRFARASTAVSLWWALQWALGSMLLSVNIAHGAPDASLKPPRETVDFSGPASPTNPSSSSQARELAQLRTELAVANTADTTTAATPIPEPTEYMLLAGGLLILWGSLRWKNRTRRPVNTPRSRLKKR